MNLQRGYFLWLIVCGITWSSISSFMALIAQNRMFDELDRISIQLHKMEKQNMDNRLHISNQYEELQDQYVQNLLRNQKKQAVMIQDLQNTLSYLYENMNSQQCSASSFTTNKLPALPQEELFHPFDAASRCAIVLPTNDIALNNNTNVINSYPSVYRILFSGPRYLSTAGQKTDYIISDLGNCLRAPQQEDWPSNFKKANVKGVYCISSELPSEGTKVDPSFKHWSGLFLKDLKEWMQQFGYEGVDNIFRTVQEFGSENWIQTSTDFETFPLLLPATLMAASLSCDQVDLYGFVPFGPTSWHVWTKDVMAQSQMNDAIQNQTHRLLTSKPSKYSIVETNLSKCLWDCHYGTSSSFRSCDFKINNLKPTLFVQPDQYLPLNNFDSCALVGNSNTILLDKYGAEIDSHEVVIRMNTAITEENFRSGMHSEQLGRKTTHWFVNNSIARKRFQTSWLESNNITLLFNSPSAREQFWTRFESSWVSVRNISTLVILDRQLPSVEPSPEEAIVPNSKHSSTHKLLLSLLPHCKQLSFYGFGVAGNFLQKESFIRANMLMFQLANGQPEKYRMITSTEEECSLKCYANHIAPTLCPLQSTRLRLQEAGNKLLSSFVKGYL